MKEKKQPSTIQLKATDKIYKVREATINDNELASLLGLSKVTLYTRLKLSNWKKTELALINTLKA